MFKKLGRALGSKNRTKVRLDVRIASLHGLPPSVAAARVVWARDAKVQMTKLAHVAEGKASWGEELSIIATLDKNSKGIYEPKTYDFRIQAPDGQQRYVTLGRAVVDMARHVDARNAPLSLPVDLQGGGQAVLRIIVTASAVKGLIGDDAASVISGVSSLSEAALDADQDLGGFDDAGRGSGQHQQGKITPTESPLAAATLDTIPESAGPASPVDASRTTSAMDSAPVEVASAAAAVAAAAAAAAPPSPDPEPSQDHTMAPEASAQWHGDDEYEAGGERFDDELSAQDSFGYDHEEGEGPYAGDEGGYDDGDGGSMGAGEDSYYAEADVADLQAQLAAAEAAAAEAEAVAEEAVVALEGEQAERRNAEAMVAQLQRELEWSAKKAAKERADWEGRMKDSFKKMEGTVLLTERVQREKAELAERLAVVTSEKKDLEAMLDRDAVERRVAEAAAAATAAAEAQAAIEIGSLRKKVREMEEYVEEADAKALKAQGRATALAAELAGAKGAAAGADSWREVRAAEERADALSLELQYAKAEVRGLEGEVAAAREDAARAVSAARREAESHGARAAELARQLEASMIAAAAAERAVSQSNGRIVLLEDALERSNLQAAELRQRLVAAAAGGDVAAATPRSATAALAPELALAMQQVREVQDAAEGRAAQLAATSRELMAAQEALAAAQMELHAARQELADAQRVVAARDDEVLALRDQLRAKESQGLELRALQKDMAAMIAAGGGNLGGMLSPRRPASAAAAAPAGPPPSADQVAAAEARAAEADALARSAALQTADLIQQLAAASVERQEATSKVSEMREELAALRSASDGDLLRRVEALERELVVARNRADVNALFREEHERIAGELISTKLAWAEGQGQIVVLKRSLVKAQEKSMGFAAKLTKLETKLYRRLTTVGRRKSNTSLDAEAKVEEGSRPDSAASGGSGSRRKSSKGSGSGRKSRTRRPASGASA